MKKIISLVFCMMPLVSHAVVEFDLRKGVDLTATNYVTASLLNQLVDAGTISSTNKGAIIRRSGGGGSYWPDVTLNPRYTNFIWLDLNTSPGTVKQYVCCGDVYSNWVPSTVTALSVGTAEIANYAVTSVKLATNSVENWHLIASSVSGNKIADNGIIAGKLGPASVILGNFAPRAITGGDITNKTITYTNIADNTIGPLQLAADAIGTATLTNGAVTTDKIAETNITRTLIRDDAIGSLQITNGAVTSNKIAAATIHYSNINTNYAYALPAIWGFIRADGTIGKGLGIASVSADGVSAYRITFTTARTDTNYAVHATPLFKSAATGNMGMYYSNQTDSVWIRFSTDGGANNNPPFSFVIHDF